MQNTLTSEKQQALLILAEYHLDTPEHLEIFLQGQYAEYASSCLNMLHDWGCVTSVVFVKYFKEKSIEQTVKYIVETAKLLKSCGVLEKDYAYLLITYPKLMPLIKKMIESKSLKHLEWPFFFDVLSLNNNIDEWIQHLEYLLQSSPKFLKYLNVNVIKMFHPQFEWHSFLEFFDKYHQKIDKEELVHLWFNIGENYKYILLELLGFLKFDCQFSLENIEKLLYNVSMYQWLTMGQFLPSLQGCVEPLVNQQLFDDIVLLQLMDWFLQHDIESSKPDAWFRLSVVLQVMLECRLLNDLNLKRLLEKNQLSATCCENISHARTLGLLRGYKDENLFFTILNSKDAVHTSKILSSFPL